MNEMLMTVPARHGENIDEMWNSIMEIRSFHFSVVIVKRKDDIK